MPIYDFRCPNGHIAEMRCGFETLTQPCPVCSDQAERLAVQRSGGHLIVDPVTGEKVANYLEAAKELEYQHSRHDDPALAPLADVYNAARYRAGARLYDEGPKARWKE